MGQDTFSGEIRAIRPISVAKEVTLSENFGINGNIRASKNPLGRISFKCTCSICARSSKARERCEYDRSIICMPVNDIGAYCREMVYDWITRGEIDHARLLAKLSAHHRGRSGRDVIFYPTHCIFLARVIMIVCCALRKGIAVGKWGLNIRAL